MTREEEFYAAILAAINGDDHTCPTPVWRIEEFLKAIHDAIASGGGSGGGVLFIGITMTESAWTLDKTFKEIDDASKAGAALYVRYDDADSNFTYPVYELNYHDNGVGAYNLSARSSMEFFADTVNDYPYMEL